MTTDHDNLTPRERALADALGRDASRWRAEPDSGFESRVLSAATHAQPQASGEVLAKIGPQFQPMLRIAAALAVLLTVGAIAIVSTRGPARPVAATNNSAPAAPDDVLADIDAWLALDTSVFARTNLAAFREELDSADTPVSFDDLGQTDIDLEEWM